MSVKDDEERRKRLEQYVQPTYNWDTTSTGNRIESSAPKVSMPISSTASFGARKALSTRTGMEDVEPVKRVTTAKPVNYTGGSNEITTAYKTNTNSLGNIGPKIWNNAWAGQNEQFNVGISKFFNNVVMMPFRKASEVLTGGWYKTENDPLVKASKSYEDYYTKLGKQFVSDDEKKNYSTGESIFYGTVRSLAPMLTTGMLGRVAGAAGTGTSATTGLLPKMVQGKEGLEKVAQVGSDLKNMIPFGASAGGGAIASAEENNPNLTDWQKFGIGASNAFFEISSESAMMPQWFKKVIGSGNTDMMESGAQQAVKTFGDRFVDYAKKHFASDVLKNGFQEAMVDPPEALAEKLFADPEKTWVGKDGVFDAEQMAQDFAGGMLMSVMLGGFGLPESSKGRQIAENAVAEDRLLTPEEAEIIADDVAAQQDLNSKIVIATVPGLGDVEIVSKNEQFTTVKLQDGSTSEVNNALMRNAKVQELPRELANPTEEVAPAETPQKLSDDERLNNAVMASEAVLKDFDAGKITHEEYTKKLADIDRELYDEPQESTEQPVEVKKTAKTPTPSTMTDTLQSGEGEAVWNEIVASVKKDNPNTDLKLVNAKSGFQKHIVKLMKSLGTEVVFYKGEGSVNGFVNPKVTNTIFVKVDNKHNELMQTAGHEFLHIVRKRHSSDYQSLIGFARQYFTAEARDKYLKDFKNDTLRDRYSKDEDLLLEEMLADELGNNFTNHSFWDSLYRHSKELFEKLVKVAKGLIDEMNKKGSDADKSTSEWKTMTYVGVETARSLSKEFEKVIKSVRAQVAGDMVDTEAKIVGAEGQTKLSARGMKTEKKLEVYSEKKLLAMKLEQAVERGYLDPKTAHVIDAIMKHFPEAWKEHLDVVYSNQEFALGSKEQKGTAYSKDDKLTSTTINLKMGEMKKDAKNVIVMFKDSNVLDFVHQYGDFLYNRVLSGKQKTEIGQIQKETGVAKKVFKNSFFGEMLEKYWLQGNDEVNGKKISKGLDDLFFEAVQSIKSVADRFFAMGDKDAIDNRLKHLIGNIIGTGEDYLERTEMLKKFGTDQYYSDEEVVYKFLIPKEMKVDGEKLRTMSKDKRWYYQGFSANAKTGWSYDPSSNCPKKDSFIKYVLDHIEKHNIPLSRLSNDKFYAELYNKAKKEGVTVPCEYCYVEEARRKALEYHTEGAKKTGVNFAQGKQLYSNRPYIHEILNFTKKDISEMNKRGGLRIFSFSDYVREQHHDLIEMVLQDAAQVGLAVKVITKQTTFIEDFGHYGINIQLSIDSDGKNFGGYDWTKEDDGSPKISQGVDWDEAFKLSAEYPNVVIRTLAKNKDEIRAYLDLKNPVNGEKAISVITPYHGDATQFPHYEDMTSGRKNWKQMMKEVEEKQKQDEVKDDEYLATLCCAEGGKCFNKKRNKQCATNCGIKRGNLTIPIVNPLKSLRIINLSKNTDIAGTEVVSEDNIIVPQSAEDIKNVADAHGITSAIDKQGKDIAGDMGISYSIKKDKKYANEEKGLWKRGASFDEVKAEFPNLFGEVDASEEDKRHPTQIATTVSTYKKIYQFLSDKGFKGNILDASSGLGKGTEAGKQIGLDVDDLEPYPDKNYHPKYTKYSDVDKQYDVIISNAVLNVIPQDLRDGVVEDIGRLLKPNGRAFIMTRGKDVENAKSKIAVPNDTMAYYIPEKKSYQKGFTPKELKAYIEDILGDDFTVEAVNSKNSPFDAGKEAVVVTKKITVPKPKKDEGNSYSASGAEKYFEAAEKSLDIRNNANFKKWFGKSKVVDKHGKPLKVYHGTSSEFFSFDKSRGGSYSGARSAKEGFFFVDNPKVADTYREGEYNLKPVWEFIDSLKPNELKRLANNLNYGGILYSYDEDEDFEFTKDNIENMVEDFDKTEGLDGFKDFVKQAKFLGEHFNPTLWQKIQNSFDTGYGKRMDVYLKMENPLDVSPEESEGYFEDGLFTEVIQQAKKDGHDGVIFRDVADAITAFDENNPPTGDVYVVFEPNQIKDATGLNKTFSLENDDIRYSGNSATKYFDAAEKMLNEKQATFYSKLNKTIEDKMANSAPADSIMNMLRKNGVKEEEIMWSGIEDYLQENPKPKKSELMEFLNSNELQFKDVVKKEDTDFYYDTVAAEITERLQNWDEMDRTFKRLIENWRTERSAEAEKELKTMLFKHTHIDFDDVVSDVQDTNFEDIGTKYNKYISDGGTNYREVLITLPNAKEGYQSGHWDEDNVLAHTRLQDFTDSKGNKILRIEEIQSDWHQEGRKRGYNEPGAHEKLGEIYTKLYQQNKEYRKQIDEAYKAKDIELATKLENEKFEIEKKLMENRLEREALSERVADAPFKKNWHEFVFKKILREAVENGYSKVEWTSGKEQADRYNLSKHVSMLVLAEYTKGEYTLEAWRGRTRILTEKNISDRKLRDTVGEEIANKLLENLNNKKPDFTTFRTTSLSGEGLEIGGHGMKGFYDKMLPDFVKKYVKKWGAEVTKTEEGRWQVNITDAMKSEVLYKGQTLYSAKKKKEKQDPGPNTPEELIAHYENQGKEVPMREMLEKFGGHAVVSYLRDKINDDRTEAQSEKLSDAMETSVPKLEEILEQTDTEKEAKEAIGKYMKKALGHMNKAQKSWIDSITESVYNGDLDVEDLKNVFAAKWKIPNFTDYHASIIIDATDRIDGLEKGTPEYNKLANELNDYMTSLRKHSIWEHINTFENLMMLSGPKSAIRNILGNLARLKDYNVEEFAKALGDILITMPNRLTGKPYKRSVLMPNVWEQIKGLGQGEWAEIKDVTLNRDTRDVEDNREFANYIKYKDPVRNILQRWVRLLMSDRAFKQSVLNDYVTRAEKLARINKVEFDIVEAKKVANEVADETFFNGSDGAIEGILKARKWLNALIPNAYMHHIKGDAEYQNSGEWGIGSWVLKFAKVPYNVSKFAVEREYHLAALKIIARTVHTGFAKAKNENGGYIDNKRFNTKAFVSDLSKLGNGFLITFLGSWLWSMGLVHVRPDDEDKDYKLLRLEKLLGRNKYQLNLSAIRRLFQDGGKQTDQPGDHYATLDWFVPTSILLIGGVKAQQLHDSKLEQAGDRDMAWYQKWLEDAQENIQGLFDGTMEQVNGVLEMPMLATLTKLKYAEDATDKMAMLLLDAPARFLPAPVKYAKDITDNTQRETYANSKLEQTANNIKARMPGVSKQLYPKIDMFGEELKAYPTGNTIGNIFVNPAAMSYYSKDPEARKLIEVYDKFRTKEHMPTEVDKTWTIKREDYPTIRDKEMAITLTPSEYYYFQVEFGKKVKEALKTFSVRDTEESQHEEDLAIQRKYTKAKNDIKAEILKRRGITN